MDESGLRRLPVPAEALVLAGALAAVWATSRYDYLLFHSLAELVAVTIALCVFLVAWNVRGLIQSPYLLALGVALLPMAALDTLHALAYKGMGVFPNGGSDLPTQLWIAGRYLQTLALVAAPFAIGRTARPALWLAISLALATGLGAAVFTGVFPHCYVEGTGLTTFKKTSEYAISGLLLVSAWLLWRRRFAFDATVLRLLLAATGFAIASELAFTVYVGVYDWQNLLGHLLRIVVFAFVYRAIIQTGLRDPYRLLFRELKQREDALQATNAELESFAYSVSHDLQAPLRAIDGFARELELEAGDASGLVARITAAAERMGGLIDDLLRLSRTMRAELRPEPIDLAAIARAVDAELREREPQRRVEFVCPDAIPAEGDPGLVHVVLENLLGNAWKFTSGRPEARIELAVEQNGGRRFVVRDNGVGFDPRYADRLFAPFQRLHRADEFAGNGIGLATVRRIVARHGGAVAAAGEPDRGAAISFSLGPTGDRP